MIRANHLVYTMPVHPPTTNQWTPYLMRRTQEGTTPMAHMRQTLSAWVTPKLMIFNLLLQNHLPTLVSCPKLVSFTGLVVYAELFFPLCTEGIAGIGYKISTYEAEHENKEYDNLPYALVTSGATKSAAYSLWLNDIRSGTGSILFGGVNKAKYDGELQTLPIVPVYNRYYSLAIALTEVSVQSSSSSSSYSDNLPLAVSLDTGTSLTALPESLVNKIYKDLNVTYDEKASAAYIECDMIDKDYNVTYSFSGAEITVGISELILDATAEGFPTGTCIFGLVPSQEGLNLLGDTFLRSAYVVYDLENNEISLANTNFNPGDDDILEIGTGTSAVPGATLVPSAVSTATGNGAAATGSNTGSAITVTITSTGGSTSTAGANSAPTSGSESALTSSTSSALAAMSTTNAKHLLSGLAGAGILLIV